MSSSEKNVEVLTAFGLTGNQAKVYLATARLRERIASITLPIRHSFVKVVAPRLYETAMTHFPVPRGMVRAVKEKFGTELLVGVEIGVFQGIHAESIIKTLNIKRLYLIDPYESYMDNWGFKSHEKLSKAFVYAKKRLDPYSNKIQWVKKPSEQASEQIPNSLDFVYIDGNHNYESVKTDIQTYYPKLKKGGILGGHNFEVKYMGVVKAVMEFARKERLNVNGFPPCDWWVFNI